MILEGDCRETLKTLDTASVNCCITSPPYYDLREYGYQSIGSEYSVAEYIQSLVTVFREVKRVLCADGVLWIVIGDTYKNGRLCCVPWTLAFALGNMGWYLRQDIIWNKPNTMPENVKNRCTKAHEYIFMFVKGNKYFFNQMQELAVTAVTSEIRFGGSKYGDSADPKHATKSGNVYKPTGLRNKRSVWTVTTKPSKLEHEAAYPPDLIIPCVEASPEGGVILDPFAGTGTTAVVASQLGRKYIMCEQNPQYVEFIKQRLGGQDA